jgi:hypothetical protein
MAKVISIQMNYKGMKQIMKSAPVLADLLRRGRAVQAAAGSGFMVTHRIGSSRARVSVITSNDRGRRAEATNRSLTRALDAARGA